MHERRKRKLVGVLKIVSSGATVDRSGQSRRPTTRDPQQQGARPPTPPTPPPPGRRAALPAMGAVRELCTSSFQALLCPTLARPPGAAGTASSVLQLLPRAIRARTEIEARAALVNLLSRVQCASGADGVNMLISSWSETSTWRTVGGDWCCLETQ